MAAVVAGQHCRLKTSSLCNYFGGVHTECKRREIYCVYVPVVIPCLVNWPPIGNTCVDLSNCIVTAQNALTILIFQCYTFGSTLTGFQQNGHQTSMVGNPAWTAGQGNSIKRYTCMEICFLSRQKRDY